MCYHGQLRTERRRLICIRKVHISANEIGAIMALDPYYEQYVSHETMLGVRGGQVHHEVTSKR